MNNLAAQDVISSAPLAVDGPNISILKDLFRIIASLDTLQ
jgi:hypothetical protein